jgi:hypothetical protein
MVSQDQEPGLLAQPPALHERTKQEGALFIQALRWAISGGQVLWTIIGEQEVMNDFTRRLRSPAGPS